MEGPAFENAPKVLLGGRLLVGVDESDERLSDEFGSLCAEVVRENGIQIDELEGSGEKGPI